MLLLSAICIRLTRIGSCNRMPFSSLSVCAKLRSDWDGATTSCGQTRRSLEEEESSARWRKKNPWTDQNTIADKSTKYLGKYIRDLAAYFCRRRDVVCLAGLDSDPYKVHFSSTADLPGRIRARVFFSHSSVMMELRIGLSLISNYLINLNIVISPIRFHGPSFSKQSYQ